MEFLLKVAIRSVLAVIVGIIIGSERARHGRAAGMRTHILVALGAALTSLVSVYAIEVLEYHTDVFRLSAQVISGVGFLGAGMIVLKSNNMITGLTTAAGVWTTSVIGIAIGCGFYYGTIIITALYMIAMTVLSRFEKRKKQSEAIYIEIDDMYKANDFIKKIEDDNIHFTYHFLPPKSGFSGNLGINLIIENKKVFNIDAARKYDNVVFIEEED